MRKLFGNGAYNGAEISPCKKYRYTLWRVWDEKKPVCLFIGLNPSTADATQDDPTIRRCIDFAKRFGCGRLVMGNLFAFRATDPEEMKAYRGDPIGPENDYWLNRLYIGAHIRIAAWGVQGSFLNRDKAISENFRLDCLGKTKGGHPRHPLYLPKGVELRPFNYDIREDGGAQR